MREKILRTLAFGVVAILSLGFFVGSVYADDDSQKEESPAVGTSIRLSPANLTIQLSANTRYENIFEVKNEGDADIKVEVYAAPYSYTYSEEEDLYKLGFNGENKYTQISRWIRFEDVNGNYIDRVTLKIKAGEALNVNYRVTAPSSLPSGGQYAVIFVHALSSDTNTSGIRTEASPGIVVYGHSTEGKSEISGEISNLEINRGITEGNATRNNIYAYAKVKNTGNIDFNATGKLKVEPIIGISSYETSSNGAIISVIPEVELVLTDEWKETPSFGVYKATWEVTANNETKNTEKIIFLISPLAILITIILLTFLTIWIIIRVRKRKARRSRLAV